MSYKKGDKIVVNIADISDDGYYRIGGSDFSIWLGCSDLEKLSVAGYTELLETKITNQATEITKLISQNKSLKDKIQELILEKSQLIEMYDKLSSSRLKQIDDNAEQDRNIDDALIQGQNEAWELARKINDMDIYDTEEIFIEAGAFHLGNVLENYTYSEAAAKVEAWEKAKEEIKVGDIIKVDVNGLYAIVIHENDEFAKVIYADGNVYLGRKDGMTKTGRHIDIDSFFKADRRENNER